MSDDHRGRGSNLENTAEDAAAFDAYRTACGGLAEPDATREATTTDILTGSPHVSEGSSRASITFIGAVVIALALVGSWGWGAWAWYSNARSRTSSRQIDEHLADLAGRQPTDEVEAQFVQDILKTERKVLGTLGYIKDPSPGREKFLRAHRSELPNLVIKKSNEFEVSLNSGLSDGMNVESCQRVNRRLVKCSVQSRRFYEGWAINGIASRFENDSQGMPVRIVDLPGTLVSAPTRVYGPAELTIMIPEDAEIVRLSYVASEPMALPFSFAPAAEHWGVGSSRDDVRLAEGVPDSDKPNPSVGGIQAAPRIYRYGAAEVFFGEDGRVVRWTDPKHRLHTLK